MRRFRSSLGLAILATLSTSLTAQQGSIRGVVLDEDFGSPLAGAQVRIVETGRMTTSTDQGSFLVTDVPAGSYTLVFSKDGYVRQPKTNVVVSAGQVTELNVSLAGEFTDMEEFIVQDALSLSAGSEAGLLQLRLESPALMDSISADLMSRAGASDAASALRLVAGASVQDGKSAVIRGLPDRYVSNQMNGVRLPSADEDKRAVELDQFPTAVIESIRVSKTFTPDQQGDAAGGAVDIRLKGIPTETTLGLKFQLSFNSQVHSAGDDFLTYNGGGLNFWGRDGGKRDIQIDDLGGSWEGAVGTTTGDVPNAYKWSIAGGHSHTFDNGITLGGFASFFYERDNSYFDNGIDDSFWVDTPGKGLTPRFSQGAPSLGEYKTALFDVTQASQLVQWGGLLTLGLEYEEQAIGLTYLYTRTTEDTATLATDTRGKQYFFPGYDPDDPMTPGHEEPEAAPYLRLETLQYQERDVSTLQFNGRHTLPVDDFGPFSAPEIDWIVAFSAANLDEPDKRQFGAYWLPAFQVGPFTFDPQWLPFKPSANFNLGNLQRTWKTIEEDSTQYSVNLKLPFRQWEGETGYLKFGFFRDQVEREFDQDSFSNFNDNSSFVAGFNQPWSGAFPFESHPITASDYDVDYEGELRVTAWYLMVDLPLLSNLKVVGGARFESTTIGIVNIPEELARWFPPGSSAQVNLLPGEADADFDQDDILPAVSLEYRPFDELTLRAAYSKTVARQTFKELTPILQQEFLGGPIFIGNPDLQMSGLTNYDLRVDYTPYPGGLLSASWFKKDIKDAIENVQRVAASFDFTTAVNYPEGKLSGFEFEVRQDLGRFWSPLEGLSIGANATFIDSEVTLTDEEIAGFSQPNIQAPLETREMTNAPEHLYNIYLTYDSALTGTQIALFYTVQGDTLIAGAGQATNNFVPSIFAKEFDTLNLSVTQRIGEHFKLQFQAKNLTNPTIETVYRSKYTGDDVTQSSSTKGIEYSISISAEFTF